MSKYIIPHDHIITKENRQALNGHKSCILWYTGLSGSGKSTIASKVEEKLFEMGMHTYILDGDNIRMGLNKGLGFSEEDRKENIRRIGEVAKLFVDAGVIVSTAFISPFRSDRDMVRNLVKPGEFIEIYVNTPLDVCEQRDPKGLYKKARAGEIKQFTGIDSPYEAPEHPELEIKTAGRSVEECAAEVLRWLQQHQYIPAEEPALTNS
ncbi:MAG: adenylyl-sulfate kinase [Chitinophagales bacterium]|nr:adenylyl-sulfate kinase [Chitinophagales bacterium]MDW8394546.1 adenylyl-sulfate kinase [Chitinophagales bacterium]